MKKFLLVAVIVFGMNTVYSEEILVNKPHTVIVFLEAKPGKEEALKQALLYIAEKSREEDSCIHYRLHQDNTHPTKFALYEQWKSPELHQEQFDKSYIKEFMELADPLLAKPYEGLFGVEIEKEAT